MNLVCLNWQRHALSSSIFPIMVNAPYAVEKNVEFVIAGYNVLYICQLGQNRYLCFSNYLNTSQFTLACYMSYRDKLSTSYGSSVLFKVLLFSQSPNKIPGIFHRWNFHYLSNNIYVYSVVFFSISSCVNFNYLFLLQKHQ